MRDLIFTPSHLIPSAFSSPHQQPRHNRLFRHINKPHMNSFSSPTAHTHPTHLHIKYPPLHPPPSKTRKKKQHKMTDPTSPLLHRPVPRRPFDLPGDSDHLDPYSSDADRDVPPRRSRSAVSLTASTLFGIYGRTYTDEPATPSQLTRNNSMADFNFNGLSPLTSSDARPSLAAREEAEVRAHRPKETASGLVLRGASLFVFGVAYGVIITHLHEGGAGLRVGIDRWATGYLVFWGLAGVGLGSVLPWLDGKDPDVSGAVGRTEWIPAVRSIGAFVGIAYGIVPNPPPPFFSHSNFGGWMLTPMVATSPLAINPPGLARPRVGEPVPVVPRRPYPLRLLVRVAGGHHWYRLPSAGQSGDDTGTRECSPRRTRRRRPCVRGRNRGWHLDRQRVVLCVRLLWKHRKEVGD